MIFCKRVIFMVLSILFLRDLSMAQNIYELRKLTEDDWLEMTTEERLQALGTSQKHEANQTFLGNFGRYQDLYRRWGYEYYEMEDRYENYAFRNYHNYYIYEDRRRKWSYNEFGDRINKMSSRANIWKEKYFGEGRFYLYMPFDFINNVEWRSEMADGLWLARESTTDWGIHIIGSGQLRTKFTPLTLSKPNIYGMSADFQSAKTSIKIVNSALIGAFRSSDTGSQFSMLGEETLLYNMGGVILRGGHLRRKIGVLSLGASYVNSYGVQGSRERGDEWRGTVNNRTPTPIMVAVRYLDDSPEDGEGGPIVYDLRLKVNGRYREEIIPQVILDDVSRDRVTALSIKGINYLEPRISSAANVFNNPEYFDHLSINSSLPKFVDLININDLVRGYASDYTAGSFDMSRAQSYYSYMEQDGKSITVDGNEAVVYVFDLGQLTEKINRIEAVTTVANDYRIQTSMIYTLQSRGGHGTTEYNKAWYDATYWRTAAQAEGNIKNGSNVRTINLDFGYQVASVIYGLDFDFNYLGFKMKGEYVTNSSHYMFADGKAGTGIPSNFIAGLSPRTGHRWSQIDNAYYVTVEKEWEKFGFAGEIFKMGKFYRPYFDCFYPTPANVGHSAWQVTDRNSISRLFMIEDNDDDDFYPDSMTVHRYLGYRIYDLEDPDGVFPGNDEDNDGFADNNKNGNAIPDWNEPFLMFDSDPDEFVFGDDFNNNTIPDFREDDMKVDTPYDLDRQGHHFNMRYKPHNNIDIIVGSLRSKGVGLSNRTNDRYCKLQFHYEIFDVGKLYAEYRYEKINDNIRDPYVQVDAEYTSQKHPRYDAIMSAFSRDLAYDELEYRNSHVNKLFLDSKVRAIPSITLENHMKFERNNQLSGTMYDKTFQPHDVLNTLAISNKITYTKRLGNWIFSPGIKFRLYKKVRSKSLQPLDHSLLRIPLIMVKYIISPDTDISLGMQGISDLPLRYIDYVQTYNDYRQKTYLFQIQNRTGYFGYNVWGAAGFTMDTFWYDEFYRQYEEYKSTTTFVKMYIGW